MKSPLSVLKTSPLCEPKTTLSGMTLPLAPLFRIPRTTVFMKSSTGSPPRSASPTWRA